MSRLSWLQKIYWTRFSKPVAERTLVRFLMDHSIESILEIGVGEGSRLQRIAKLAQKSPNCDVLRYVGVDEFEASAASRPHLTLKQAHQLASQLGFKASLVPGTPAQALPRVAHKFSAADLVIIDGGIDLSQPTQGPIGSWLNRLAHSNSTVIACQQPGQPLAIVPAHLLELPIVKAA
jgi:hypothetical protein